LEEAQIAVCFCPSKATAQVLVQELPVLQSKKGSSTESPQKVLYPASAQAKPTLQSGLEARGFCVTRLDTYDTVTAVWGKQEQQIAAQTAIACFASPSAVKGWLQNSKNSISVRAACIGETSASECREQGWPEEWIFYPEKPGLDGWVLAVMEAANSVHS
jgi:uroporphyrinogen-III synthase